MDKDGYLYKQTTPQQMISKQEAKPQNPTPTTTAAGQFTNKQRKIRVDAFCCILMFLKPSLIAAE